MWFINIFYWLQAFAAPVIIMAVIGIAVGDKSVFTGLVIGGAVFGIITAEYIRRTYGLGTFFSSIYGSEKLNKKNEKPEPDQDKTL
ncbi:MAG: hypothetical protein U0U70_10265 [Chitinophagaceae bacterium]